MPVVKFEIEITKDGIPIAAEIISIAVDEWSFEQFEVADSTVEGNLMPRNITTAQCVYIDTDQNVTILFAASGTAKTLNVGGVLMITGTSETVVLVTNASGNTANMNVGIGGT